MAKDSKQVDGATQYKKVLKEYSIIRDNLKRLERQHQSLTTQGVNIEGQLKALRDVFDIDEEALLAEINAKSAEEVNVAKEVKEVAKEAEETK